MAATNIRTLKDLMEHFFLLYGRRGRICLPSLEKRIHYLSSGIGDLQDAIRKEVHAHSIGDALSRVVRRVCCIAEHFRDLDFIGTMARKYPLTRCAYCTHLPCDCPPVRQSVTLEECPNAKQLAWSFGAWCKKFNEVYGEKNRFRGIENLMNRLFKEATELHLLLLQVESGQKVVSLNEVEKEFLLELADALAWTIAIANFLAIDLESEVIEKYGKGCGHCKCLPCSCKIIIFEQKRYVE